MRKKKRSKKQWELFGDRKHLMIAVIAFLLLLIIGGGLIYHFRNGRRQARDPMAVSGLLPGKTKEEIEKLLNTKVEKGMVNIGVAAETIFEEGGKKGRLAIENIPANHYAFQVDLFLEGGELIYQSGLIDPGYYIEYVKLNDKITPGDYNATVVCTAYTMDGAENQISESQVKVKLHIIEETYYK